MTLTEAVLERARWWATQKFVETSTNAGPGIDDIQIAFDGGLSREAYCTKFVWVVFDQASRLSGRANSLPKTARARELVTLAETAGLDVDDSPSIGSVFYRRSTCSNCTGHVGIVYDIRQDAIITVEGNHSNRIDFFTVTWDQVHDASNGFAFIHVDNVLTDTANGSVEAIGTESPWPRIALVTGAVAIAWFLWEEWA